MPAPTALSLAIVLSALVAGILPPLCRQHRAARSARDRALAEAAAATRMLRLVGGDLRLPALKLLGHADGLRRAGDLLPPELAWHVAALAGISAQLMELADDLQDHGAGEAARVINPEPVRLGPLLDEAIAVVAAGLAPAQRQWRVLPGVGDLVLEVDRRAMRQVLVRVLANAARFSGDQDWVEVSAETVAERLLLTVADEGHGHLPGDDADRSDDSAAPPLAKSRGAGLGLALARSLMQAMGGSLSIRSFAQVGTRVTLALPCTRLIRAGAGAGVPGLPVNLLTPGMLR